LFIPQACRTAPHESPCSRFDIIAGVMEAGMQMCAIMEVENPT